MLRFDNVSKSYRDPAGAPRPVLRNISFELAAGERVAVIGRSGSGKSTLLHLAAGIDVPSEGEVYVDGRPLGSMEESERTRVRRDSVGLVFQFFYLLPHLSVYDNVALPDLIAGEKASVIAPRVNDLLQKVGLENRAHDLAQKLSGGEMQRVAICRALLRRPKILLADEPTGNLDDENGRVAMNLLFDLCRAHNAALLFVTHSRELAAGADRIWTLHSGELALS